MSLFDTDWSELSSAIAISLLPEFAMIEFAISLLEFSRVKTVSQSSSFILSARNFTVSKLASDSAEQPINAAK